eukprot:1127066-Prymnesium_polylepis.1
MRQLALLLLLTPRGRDSLGVSASCRPRLYVYSLPDGYRDAMDTRGRGMGLPLNHSHIAGMQVGLYDTDAYAGLGEIFYQRALAHRCRTYRPSDADLFFVPVFSGQMGMHGWRPNTTPPRPPSTFCAEIASYTPELLREAREALFARLWRVTVDSDLRALARRGGADHILLMPRHGQRWENSPYCEFNIMDDRFGSPVRLAIEENAGYDGSL